MTNGNIDSTRVFLVEDHPVMRIGLKMMLQEHGCHVCGETGNLENALTLLPVAMPEIAIFDLSLNGETAFNTLEFLRRQHPLIAQIVYSMHDSELFVEKALQIGVNAYVTKADPVETLIDAIAAVKAGKRFLGPTLAVSLKDRLSTQTGIRSSLPELSTREMEVLNLLGKGFSRSEIATQLDLSIRTVDTYIERLKQKLGAQSNRELVREAIRATNTG